MPIPDDGPPPVSKMQENLEPIEHSKNKVSHEER